MEYAVVVRVKIRNGIKFRGLQSGPQAIAVCGLYRSLTIWLDALIHFVRTLSSTGATLNSQINMRV